MSQAPLFVTAGGVELVVEVGEVDCVLDVEDELLEVVETAEQAEVEEPLEVEGVDE